MVVVVVVVVLVVVVTSLITFALNCANQKSNKTSEQCFLKFGYGWFVGSEGIMVLLTQCRLYTAFRFIIYTS